MLEGVKIVVLNLDSRPDRLREVSDELSNIGITDWERVSGVSHSIGWRGFNLSIDKIFRQFKDDPLLLLIEDDCLFEKTDHIQSTIEQLPENWDALWLGSNLQSDHRNRISENLYRLENGWNTHAILLTKKFRDWCLENWTPDMMVFDEWLRVNALPIKDCFVIYPMAAIQRPSFSNILNSYADYSAAWDLAKSKFK